MPIYEYRCKDCDHKFEKLQMASKNSDPECPNCESEDVKRLMSAGFVRGKGIATGGGGFTPPSCKYCH